ncbi:MAG: MarR family transcriptional regulator [Actinomyces sp.]|nr:MAG: MarR family transcriptional regulator [Actinomyces sp.]
MAEPPPLDDRLFAAVDRLATVVRSARQRLATRHGTSPLQLQIVEHLAGGRRARVGDLAAEFAVASPTISDAVSTLVDKGFVERRTDPADKRAVVLGLTPAGEELAAAVTAEFGPVRRATAGIAGAERATALHVLLRGIAHLVDAGIIRVDRSCLTCAHHEPGAGLRPGHCLLLDRPLPPADLRVDCPDHLSRTTPVP